MAFIMSSILCCVLISLGCFSLYEASYVPVLFLGSDSKHVPDDPTSAVHKLTASEFQEDFLRTLLDKDIVLLLAQDTLSLEDFSMLGNAYGTRPGKSAFPNLEKRLDTMASLLLPAVNMQPATLTSGDNPKWNVVDIKDSSKSLKDSGIQLTANNLVVIHLPPTKDVKDRAKALQTSDEILEKFAKEMEDAKVKYTLIYTASQPSWPVEPEDTSRISRNLLSTVEAAFEGCPLVDEHNNTLLYTTAISILNKTKEGAILHKVTFNCSEFKLDGSSLATEYSVQLVKKDPVLEISFHFREARGFWRVTEMSVNSGVENMTGDASLAVDGQIWVPMGFSYTCQDGAFDQNGTSSTKLAIKLQNFQIQAFNSNKTVKFGDPMDCVGFFTIPIWMSIFVTILLLVILGFGIQMVMSINTMDRFDDPKGKTISVGNVD